MTTTIHLWAPRQNHIQHPTTGKATADGTTAQTPPRFTAAATRAHIYPTASKPIIPRHYRCGSATPKPLLISERGKPNHHVQRSVYRETGIVTSLLASVKS